MAKTITQLPDATVVNGSDELIIQQSGVTKRATKTEVLAGIVNANIDAAAAIDGTKIAPNFGSQNVVTTGTIDAGGSIRTVVSGFGGLQVNANANTGNAEIVARRSRGTTASPTVVQSGDQLLTLAAQGYDGTQYVNAAFIGVSIAAAPGANDMPGQITLSTTADGGNSPTERMRIDASGNVGIGTSSPTVPLQVYRSGTNTTTLRIDNDTVQSHSYVTGSLFVLGSASNHPTAITTNNTERMRVKSTGQVRFIPLASDPAGAEAGDVYYNSGDNKLKVYNGSSWVDLH